MEIKTLKDYNNLIQLSKEFSAVCFYLSTPQCNVCKVLKPKVMEMLEKDFPKIEFYYVDLNEAKEIAGQLSVFAVPTIIIFFDGKEMIRASRNISIEQLNEQIKRYYNMIFN